MKEGLSGARRDCGGRQLRAICHVIGSAHILTVVCFLYLNCIMMTDPSVIMTDPLANWPLECAVEMQVLTPDTH